MQQMKVVFCKRLAACLCMQQSPSASAKCPLVRVTSGDGSNNGDDLKTPEDGSATKNETTDKALQGNRDLIEAEMKNDWMLAAAALDRIFAIAFAIISVGGNLAFIVIIATHS